MACLAPPRTRLESDMGRSVALFDSTVPLEPDNWERHDAHHALDRTSTAVAMDTEQPQERTWLKNKKCAPKDQPGPLPHPSEQLGPATSALLAQSTSQWPHNVGKVANKRPQVLCRSPGCRGQRGSSRNLPCQTCPPLSQAAVFTSLTDRSSTRPHDSSSLWLHCPSESPPRSDGPRPRPSWRCSCGCAAYAGASGPW